MMGIVKFHGTRDFLLQSLISSAMGTSAPSASPLVARKPLTVGLLRVHGCLDFSENSSRIAGSYTERWYVLRRGG